MTFPDTPLGHRIELDVNGAWTDITSYADHGPVQIGRGHPDESTTVSPSVLGGLALTNNDGRFTSKNPTSPYYPYLVRNIPLRVSVPAQSSYLRLEGDDTSYASCPDSAAVSITGDMEIRLELQLTDWQPCTLATKWSSSTDKTWALYLNGDGTIGWEIWDGSVDRLKTSSIPLPYTSGRFAFRVTFTANDGSGNHETVFWTSDSIDGPWTQFGDAAAVSGTITLYDSTAPVAVGYSTGYIVTDGHSGYTGPNGRIYEFRLYSGVGGTLEADPVFSAQTAGAASFADGQGNTWTLSGTAEISDRDYRGHFEVPEWPQHSGAAGTSVTVAIAGGGLLRRHSQRTAPLDSALKRAYRTLTGSLAPVAYWPMEDGAAATQIASAIGGAPMYFSGSPQLASSSAFVCSGALPAANGAVFSGLVPSASWTDNVVRFLLRIPSGGESNGAVVATVTTTGTVATLTLSYGTGGSMTLTGYDASGTQVFTSGSFISYGGYNGQAMRVSMTLQSNGSGSVKWAFQCLRPGDSSAQATSGTISGSIGGVTRVQLNPGGALTSTVLGHCSVQAVWDDLFDLDDYTTPDGLLTGPLNAWYGEPAGHRFSRLCAEEGIAFRCRGDLDATTAMGNQSAQTLVQLLQECADADRGVWYELRQALGWGYITRSALYSQAAAVTADYNADDLDLWPADPLEDDQTTVNDVTVTNSGTSTGSSARQYAAPGQPITGGRLSTQSPPDGIGTYDQSYSVNLAYDGALDSEAAWILHVGTVDQPRYPGIGLSLDNRDLAALFWSILDMDLGDRLVIDNPPVWLGPDPVSQLCQQITETFWSEEYSLVITGVPELPYQVAAEGAAHADTDGSTLHADVTSSATSLSVDTASGYPLWTTAAADFPFDISVTGERMTVTDITGSSSPQTLTVTRAVNGVAKAQSAGAAIALWNTPAAAL